MFLPSAIAVATGCSCADITAGELIAHQAGGKGGQDEDLEERPGFDEGGQCAGEVSRNRDGTAGKEKENGDSEVKKGGDR